MPKTNRCFANIYLNRLVHNYKALRQKTADSAKFMAVVKANGYGHGAVQCATALADAGADWFGLSNIDEAIELRCANLTSPMLVMGYTPPTFASELANFDITQTIYSPEYAAELSHQAELLGVVVDVHIKLDTGMSRLGFCPDDPTTLDCLWQLHQNPHINITGVFTHFAVSDQSGDGDSFTAGQFERFLGFCDKMKQRGIPHGLRHCCNSGGILRHPDKHLDMVRGGIALYGLPPSQQSADIVPLLPVMEWQVAVSMVKELSADQAVGYGCTFISPTTMRIATLSAGYADGYDRGYSNRGRVLIGGRYAPIIGRICMDQFMVDVSDIPDVSLGDMAILVGRQGQNSITFDELSGLSGSINYELACRVSQRVERVYHSQESQ